MPRLLLSLLPLILAWVPAEAQGNPGTNLSVSVDVVSLTRSGDTSQVSYVARNSSSSRESMWALTIEAPAEPRGISHPLPAKSWMIASQYGDRPVVQWSTLIRSLMMPGASSPTLSFKAIGLPAIVDAHIKGHYDPPDIDTLEGGDSILALDPLEFNSVAAKVVGVGPPPPGPTPASLTSRLETLTAQSCTLGWISQPGLCTTLRGHLTAQPARLTAFRDDLAAGHTPGGPVSDNAYWLLKVNAEYIISLLPPSTTVYLAGSGGTANPPTLSLSSTAPTGTTAKYKDSPAIQLSGGNPWVQVGTWSAASALTSGTLSALGNAQVWLGAQEQR